jgi:hypothetical protein
VAANDRYTMPYPCCNTWSEHRTDTWDDPYKEYESNPIYGPRADSGQKSSQASDYNFSWALGQGMAQEPRQNGWAVQMPDASAMMGMHQGGFDKGCYNPCPKPPCPRPPEPPYPKPPCPKPPCPKPPEPPCPKPPENPCTKPIKIPVVKPCSCPKPPEPKPLEKECPLLRRDPCKKHPRFPCHWFE